ncbi:MAG TPA: CopD family protein [Actinocrinis sp.]|uniref:copper resistance CopC/CopD family protein n=1 Tax=Actinocrinis sp. TaxID=1920516 RepID=UPI002D5CD82D|nr:CopD family protein [Actinocrinis sp.]HZU56796.1 CopD family protein [Actinocrinis sp.]
MSHVTRLALLVCVALMWLVGSLISAPAAVAHAELLRSDPADGARLSAVPAHVTMTFTEGIAIHDCSVRAEGHALPIHQPAGQPDVLIADLSGIHAAPSGRLELDWRSVSSDDGHIASGSIGFQLPAAAASPSATSGATAPNTTSASTGAAEGSGLPGPSAAVHNALVAVQFAGFLCVALLIGGLAFLVIAWPEGGGVPRVRRSLSLAWVLGLGTALAQIGLQAAYAALLPLSGVFDVTALESLFGTRVGAVLIARALLWLLAGVVLVGLLQQQQRAAYSAGWRVGLIAVSFGLLRTIGMTAHDDSSHPLIGAIADTAHLAGVSLWIGGLVILLFGVLPRRVPGEMATAVARYSNLALVSMLAIIGAGALLAWQVVGSVHDLLHTSYGHTLLLKLALVTAVLALAQHSKAWVRHRLDVAVILDGDRATVRPFVYSVAAEAGLALAILAAASVLVTSSPGR